MSFDIFGNSLLPGHCEVHPHVHQPYPCSQCYAEAEHQKSRKKEMKDQRDAEARAEAQYWEEQRKHHLLNQAIAKFGVESQINKIQEEAIELALALNQRNCPTKDPVQMEENLYDELADMKIMMAQAELIFDATRINERVEFKLNRFEQKYLNTEGGAR